MKIRIALNALMTCVMLWMIGLVGCSSGEIENPQVDDGSFMQSPADSNQLQVGQWLHTNDRLVSADGRYVLLMQGDGNLVIYRSGVATWASSTFGANIGLAMQADGNLVLYQNQTPRWSSDTWGHPGAHAVLNNDGSLAVVRNSAVLWTSGAANALRIGGWLRANERLVSPDGRYVLLMQGDGNLVIYRSGIPTWASSTFGDKIALTMQGDGNLVLYQNQTPRWASNTFGHPGAHAALNNDGSLAVELGNQTLWSTGAAVGEEVLVGAIYFGGWWQGPGDKFYTPAYPNPLPQNYWLDDFPERRPLLGLYTSQQLMDAEIVSASNHGIDFFSMDWYNLYDRTPLPGEETLNNATDYFMASPENDRMRFFLEFANHGPFNAHTDAEWQRLVDQHWLRILAHDRYLRVNGKLVFKILHYGEFWTSCGGKTDGSPYDFNAALACAQGRLRYLRQRVAAAGLGQMLIGAGVEAEGAYWNMADNVVVRMGFDWTGTYATNGSACGASYPNRYPYATLSRCIETGRLQHAADPIPYVPIVTTGWITDPWQYANQPTFEYPSEAQWRAVLQTARGHVLNHPNLGFPGQPAIIVNAWNEYGEGGFIAPSAGWGTSRLDAIRGLF